MSVVLVTGCSSGLGRELALTALSKGLCVIATARRLETLVSLQEQGAKVLRLDVTAPMDELKSFASEAISQFGHIDCLINNAGYVQGGALEENSPEESRAQFDTNFFGVLNVTNALLPHFRARRHGTVVNISSHGAVLSVVGAGLYCASKAALDALSSVWALELAPFNIRCVSIQLGALPTSVAQFGSLQVAAARIEDYTAPHDFVAEFNKASGTERGDTRIAAAKIIELVSADAALPMRLPLGDDAYEDAKAFYSTHQQALEKWKAVSTGTDAAGRDEATAWNPAKYYT